MFKAHRVHVVTIGNVLQGAFTRKASANKLKTALDRRLREKYTTPVRASVDTEYWATCEMGRVSRD